MIANDDCEGKMEEEVLAKFIDDKGDTQCIVRCGDSLTVMRVTDSDVSDDDYFRILPDDALTLLDLAGLNTTANELRAKLEEARELFKRAQELIEKHEKLTDEQNALLAEANQTIAQLRQADTVRPGVDLAAVWNEGYDAYDSNEAEGTQICNPYLDSNAVPILCTAGQKALGLIEQFGGIDGEHHKTWVIDQVARALTGLGYDEWVTEMNDGEDGPNTYEWDTGIAP